MKYKLINNQTKEEHLCDKITIDGFNYYVNDGIQLGSNNVWVATKSRVFKFEVHMAVIKTNMPRLIIATNNPNIDIPKVINNSNLILLYNKEQCIGFEVGYRESQKTHPFSEEDTVNFAKHMLLMSDNERKSMQLDLHLKLWKEQQTKTVYYES